MGRFKAGQPRPTNGGRKKGTPNKKTQKLLDILESKGLNVPEKIIELLPKLDFKDQVTTLLSLMSYLYPKRKAVEFVDSDGKPMKNTFKVEFVNPKETD